MCDNQVLFYVTRGYGYRETSVTCGNTDPWGKRTVCETCGNDAQEMRRIRDHEENVAADNAWLASAGWGEM